MGSLGLFVIVTIGYMTGSPSFRFHAHLFEMEQGHLFCLFCVQGEV